MDNRDKPLDELGKDTLDIVRKWAETTHIEVCIRHNIKCDDESIKNEIEKSFYRIYDANSEDWENHFVYDVDNNILSVESRAPRPCPDNPDEYCTPERPVKVFEGDPRDFLREYSVVLDSD